ncbi:MAG: hypothetical protein ACKVU4_02275 [Phycisphaerales bacterium]
MDENLPHDLRHFLPGHEAFTVAHLGWKGLANGALLAKAAEHGFDAVLTIDAGIRHEQSATELPVRVIVVRAASNTLDDLRPLVPLVLKTLESMTPRTLAIVGN